jgi:hypothetical protein
LGGRVLDCYRRRDGAGAIGLYEQALRLRPEDEPARRLIARCRDHQDRPPGAGWDGTLCMEGK